MLWAKEPTPKIITERGAVCELVDIGSKMGDVELNGKRGHDEGDREKTCNCSQFRYRYAYELE